MSDIPSGQEPEDRESAPGEQQGSGGRGTEGTIPADPDGVAAGVTDEKNTFEPEEEPDVTGVHE